MSPSSAHIKTSAPFEVNFHASENWEQYGGRIRLICRLVNTFATDAEIDLKTRYKNWQKLLSPTPAFKAVRNMILKVVGSNIYHVHYLIKTNTLWSFLKTLHSRFVFLIFSMLSNKNCLWIKVFEPGSAGFESGRSTNCATTMNKWEITSWCPLDLFI